MPSRLKSLELHGYKTFASRTLFEFAGPITAIVGPNGSGKSNIADSLRWVLGEQSYTLLRGKKTEDMIFSGSEHRPRAGMASATIIFDNSDDWLPIDFSEVAITRRAYRDGENEYLLNGQRVRLRDVSELLAQSGLAERTYTIIGQGLVDAALALKAEERRRLFEEAAGIGLHRSRREEALKRLDTTRRNLERVQDILAELQPRLRSLERQARRSQEYEQVKADLQVVLREWYGYHWHHTQRELAAARDTARQQENNLETARQEQAVLDEKLAGWRKQILELRASLSDMHRRSAGLHSRRENLSRDLAVSSERLRSWEEQRRNTSEEIGRLEEEIALQQEWLRESVEEAERLEAERCEAQAQAESARTVLRQRQAERAQVEQKVQAARQMLGSLTARQSHLQARRSERQAQAERNAASVQSADSAVAQAIEELRTAEAQLEQAGRDHQQVKSDLTAAENEHKWQRKRLSDVESTQKENQEQRAAAGAELARLKAQLDVLEQAENSLSGYASGARMLLQAARQAKLNAPQGALSNHLETPVELETAIAAALGEFVDAVVVDGQADVDLAMDLLEDQPARAAVLPRASLQPDAHLEVEPGLEGVLGVAAALVKAPEDLKPAVELLLGQVLVVSDRATARRALIGQPSYVRAVTLKGEIFLAGGAVLAGSDKKAGLLSRPRQYRELADQRTELDERIRSIDASIKEQETALIKLRNEEGERSRAAALARQREEKARTAYSQVEIGVEKARRQLQWQREQRERLKADAGQGEAEAARVSAELAPLESEIETARTALREQNAELQALSLEEFQTQLAHWNTRAAVAEQAEAEAKNRQRERQISIERTGKNRKALQDRLNELAASSRKLEEERSTLRGEEAGLGEQIEALLAVITPAEAALEEAERKQAELQVLENVSRQSLSMAEHNYAQARIVFGRRQEALDSLRRRIEDDFGLVAFEYAEEISGPTPLPLDGMVEQLPRVDQLAPDIEETIRRQRGQLRRMGPVNPEAQAEYREVKERYEFLTEQVRDLNHAESGIKAVIAELDLLMQREFLKTFDAVAHEFRDIFSRLFAGGSARLLLTDPDDINSSGIDIEARLPGRRTQGLSLLSGGERSLTATALVFSLLRVSPTPFCVLDEVDAMLDESNVGRFRDLLRELSQATQFVVVTHNRNTVQAADIIYGVTMGKDSASQVIGLKLDEVSSVVE